MRLLFALVFSLLAGGLAARADTVFNVAGTFVSSPTDLGGTMTGTLTFNSLTGTFSAVDITVSQRYSTDRYTTIANQGEVTSGVIYFVEPYLTPGLHVNLEIPDAGSLIGYNGSSLCSVTALCSNGMGSIVPRSSYTDYAFQPFYIDYLNVGALTPQVSVTPECSSFVLVGSGLVGLMDVARRRIAESKA